MTIIFQKGDLFWIESLVHPRTAVSGTTEINADLTLERPGTFLGCNLAMDVPTSVVGAEQVLINMAMRNTDNSELLIGDIITGVRLRVSNQNAGEEIIGAKVIVFMRKLGSGHP